MATRRMVVRRLEEEGEHEEIPQGRLDPQGVKAVSYTHLTLPTSDLV